MALEKKLGDTVIRGDRSPAGAKSYFDTTIYQEGGERQYGGTEDQYYTEKTPEYEARTRNTTSLAEQYKSDLPGENTQPQYVRLTQKGTENRLETEVREEKPTPRQDKRYEVPYQIKKPPLQTEQETKSIIQTEQETKSIIQTEQETKIKDPLKPKKTTKQLKPKTIKKIIKWKTKP